MNVILILRIFLTAAGVLFLLGDINAYVRQKLTDTIGLLWAFVSVVADFNGCGLRAGGKGGGIPGGASSGSLPAAFDPAV
mgnify:CR=1 FL=1